MNFKVCPKCGYKLDTDFNFCPKCGVKLAGGEAERRAKAERLYSAQNYKEALPLCLEFAQKGEATYEFRTGYCYYRIEDYVKSVYWYTKAAEQGYAKAQYNLGVCYENGRGVAKDIQKAIYWYSKSDTSEAKEGLKRLSLDK